MIPRMVQPIVALSLLSVLLVTCTDQEAPRASAVEPVAFAVSCQAVVTAGTLSCGSGAGGPTVTPGLGRSVILGGQGTYVQLTSSGTAYNSITQIFSSNVTVQNLTVQPMNSTDGTTADTGGVKVLFNSGPTVTSGSGAVTVGNADGTGTFTQSSQPFFRYSSGAVLAAGSTTASKTWQFNVPTTVVSFGFTVFVTAQLPADSSVLRWVSVSSPTTQTLRAVRINCVGCPVATAWAVGDSGTVLYYDGAIWSTVTTGLPNIHKINLYALRNTGSAGLWAVGDSGKIAYSANDGVTWNYLANPAPDTALFAIDEVGSGADTLYAVGVGGVIIRSTNGGTTWSRQTSGTTDTLFKTGGPSSHDVYAGGQAGTLLHYDGTTWSPDLTGSAASLHDGDGAGDVNGLTDLWFVGTGGTILHSATGASGTWTPQPSGATQDLFGLLGNHSLYVSDPIGKTDVFAVGSGGTIVHWNGLAWSPMVSGTSANLTAITFGGNQAPFIDWWAVGSGGKILHGIR